MLNKILLIKKKKKDLIGPYFCRKISLFLSYLVPEIIGLKVGQSFVKVCHFTILKHFVPMCFLIFNLIDLLFDGSLVNVDPFDPSFLQNLSIA